MAVFNHADVSGDKRPSPLSCHGLTCLPNPVQDGKSRSRRVWPVLASKMQPRPGTRSRSKDWNQGGCSICIHVLSDASDLVTSCQGGDGRRTIGSSLVTSCCPNRFLRMMEVVLIQNWTVFMMKLFSSRDNADTSESPVWLLILDKAIVWPFRRSPFYPLLPPFISCFIFIFLFLY